ncbi:hypothetical protein ACNKHN_24555 [Shigella flexneri]
MRAVLPALSCRAFCLTGNATGLRLERLKDKLGNRSNASCEVEVQDAIIGWLLGWEGKPSLRFLKMGGMTRFDCSIAMP